MNIVANDRKKPPLEMKLSELCGDNFDNGRSAFLGTPGFGQYGLWLVSFNGLVLARDPSATHTSPNCTVSIDRFVDVNISIVEREQE